MHCQSKPPLRSQTLSVEDEERPRVLAHSESLPLVALDLLLHRNDVVRLVKRVLHVSFGSEPWWGTHEGGHVVGVDLVDLDILGREAACEAAVELVVGRWVPVEHAEADTLALVALDQDGDHVDVRRVDAGLLDEDRVRWAKAAASQTGNPCSGQRATH